MNMSRRTVVGGLSVAILSNRLFAQQLAESDPFPPLPIALGAANDPELLRSTALGTVPPPKLLRDTAMSIMLNSPYDCAPVDVAMYFRDIGQGTIPKLETPQFDQAAGPHFVRGWHRYYNPLIAEFFTATGLTDLPDGDGTHWCAAFVNWCIARSRAKSPKLPLPAEVRRAGSYSASSGSFRCWPKDGGKPSMLLGKTEVVPLIWTVWRLC